MCSCYLGPSLSSASLPIIITTNRSCPTYQNMSSIWGKTCLMINTLKTQLDFNVVHSKTCIQVSYYLCLLSFGPFSRLQCIYPSLHVYYYLITLGFTSFLSGNLSQRIHTYIETYINNLAISSSHSALFAFLTSHRD